MNFHQRIVENKDIKKVVVILKLAISSQKGPVTEVLERFNHFKALCNEDKNLKVKV